MISIEFELLLETARTNWKEPNLPWGGAPDITANDVSLAYGRITHPFGACAIRARYAMDKYSVYKLAEWMRQLSWDLWPERDGIEETRISFDNMARVGELVVLDYINPEAIGSSVETRAAICRVGKPAWKNYIAAHHSALFNHLTGLEANGLRQMSAYLKGSEDAIGSRKCQTCGHVTLKKAV